jgi:hypothetical protein
MVERGQHRPSGATGFRPRSLPEITTMRMWIEGLFGSSQSPKRKRSYRPCFEELERRLTPTDFTWTNFWAGVPGDGKWENGHNWSGGDGTNYPSTSADTAAFKSQFQSSCTMTQAETIGAFSTQGWTGTLTLQAKLKLLSLTGGGSSSMMSGTIVQKTATTNGPIEVGAENTFDWGGGDINPTGGASTFTVDTLGSLTFGQTGGTTGKFGDNLDNSGTVDLANLGSVTLVNQPTITNNDNTLIRITVDNAAGLVVADGDVKTIQNSGSITKNGGDEEAYQIDDPVSNKADAASIKVENGALRFMKADADGYSVYQSAGTIEIDASCTLYTGLGLKQTGGKTMGLGPFGATIVGRVLMLGGTLQQGDGTRTSVGSLNITGNFTFQGGTLHTWVDTTDPNNPLCGLFMVDGNVTVTAAGTSVVVDKISNNPAPDKEMVLSLSTGHTISDTPGGGVASGTANYTQDYRGTGNDSLWVK